MTANRSLDEFGSRSDVVEEEEEPDPGDERSGDSSEGPSEEPVDVSGDEDGTEEVETGPAAEDPDEVQPAASTYAWSPDGGPCAACGGHAEERWREGDELVCVGCKDW